MQYSIVLIKFWPRRTVQFWCIATRVEPDAISKQQHDNVPGLRKTIVQKLLPAAVLRHRVRQLPRFSTDLPGDPFNAQTRPTSVGQSMIDRYADRLTEIATNRKRTAASWRLAFWAYGGPYAAFISEAEEGPVPYRFIVCPDTAMAIKLFDAFRAEGVAVESWPDLAPEVRTTAAAHQVAAELRDTLVFLPAKCAETLGRSPNDACK